MRKDISRRRRNSRSKSVSPSISIGTSIRKALSVLKAFIDGQDGWGVRELALAMGQPSSSVHRLLQVLRNDGLLDWDVERKEYRTGMELYRWSAILRQRLKITEVARPIMDQLLARVHESCWLGVYEATRRRHAYVSEVKSKQLFTYNAPIGRYEPLWATAGGLATLAHLPRAERDLVLAETHRKGVAKKHCTSEELALVRSNGYAVWNDSACEGPVSVAAPVFDARNIPVASLTVAVPAFRLAHQTQQSIGLAVSEHANQLSRMLGAQLLGAAAVGAWHDVVNAIGGVLQRQIPGVGSTIWSSGGEKMLRDLESGRGGYCLAVAGSLSAAYFGISPFQTPHRRLRAVLSLFPLYLHVFVHKNSTIRTFKDLVGKRVSAGERDFTTAHVVNRLLQLAGGSHSRQLTANLDLVYLDYAQANHEFEDGKLDAVIALTSMRDPIYEGLHRKRAIRLVPIDLDLISAYVKMAKAYKATLLPARPYGAPAKGVLTLAVPTVMVATSDRPMDEVYNVIRAIMENKDELARLSPAFSSFDVNYVFDGIDVPLHPGAVQYWRQRNVKLPKALTSRTLKK